MKYLSIILIALIANGCGYGQYPDTSYANYKSDDSMLTIDISEARYPLNYRHYVDSSKIYWQRFNKYQKLFNDELERLNNFKKPTITQRLLDYQDSSIRYKILLNRLKK